MDTLGPIPQITGNKAIPYFLFIAYIQILILVRAFGPRTHLGLLFHGPRKFFKQKAKRVVNNCFVSDLNDYSQSVFKMLFKRDLRRAQKRLFAVVWR